jgi:hypothetical protein
MLSAFSMAGYGSKCGSGVRVDHKSLKQHNR